LISGIYKLIDASLIHQHRFESISNNLANINTSAFKKEVISFNQTLTSSYHSETDFTQGPVKYTGNELDVALDSDGFFKIATTQGVRYTRNGAFTLNADGVLVTRNGDPVLGRNGPIKIEGNQISIGRDGEVAVDQQPVDKLMVVDFKPRQLLRKEGGSYYAYPGNETGILTPATVNVQQRYIESANVNPTEEIIKMIDAFRTFESAQKAIQSIDEITSKMINDPGLQQ